VLLAPALALAAWTHALAEPVAVVPFRFDAGGHVIVDVAVNGGEAMPFALDTGAGRTVLNADRLAGLGVSERPAPGAVVQGAHDSRDLGALRLRTLSFGGIAIEDFDVATMSLAHVERDGDPMYGVLGVDVLARYDLRIDFPAGTVALWPRAETTDDCEVCSGTIDAPFRLAHGTHVVFDVTIDDVAIPAILDTGSGRTGMNVAAARAIGVELPAHRDGAAPTTGHGPMLRVGRLRVGDAVLATDQTVGVVDLPVFAAFGPADEPAMLLGTGALRDRVLGVSYGVQRLYVR